MYVRVRGQAYESLRNSIGQLTPGLTEEQISQLATYAIAGADGCSSRRRSAATASTSWRCSPSTVRPCTRPPFAWPRRTKRDERPTPMARGDHGSGNIGTDLMLKILRGDGP